MIITRAESRTKVPKREKISELAKHQSTLIFYLSVHLLNKISKEAIEGGYKKSTPVAVVYKASRKDQKIILCPSKATDRQEVLLDLVFQQLEV